MSYCLFVYVTRDYEGITCIYGVRDMNSSSWLLCSITYHMLLCLLMMLMKRLHTVIVMAYIVSIFCSPLPLSCFSMSFVQIKNHTNSIFSGFLFCVRRIYQIKELEQNGYRDS